MRQRKMRQALTPALIASIQSDIAQQVPYSLIAERRGVCKSQICRIKKMPKPKIVADMTFDTPRRERATQHGIPKHIARDYAPRPLPLRNESGRSYSLAPLREKSA